VFVLAIIRLLIVEWGAWRGTERWVRQRARGRSCA
jgi:hypothetical protein